MACSVGPLRGVEVAAGRCSEFSSVEGSAGWMERISDLPEGDVQRGDGEAVAVEDDEAALEGDLMVLEDAIEGGERGGGEGLGCVDLCVGELDGDGVGFGAGVGVGVVVELEGHGVGVVVHLGDGLGEPAVDGAIHQQVAEGEHEDEGDEGDEDCSPEHAGAEAGAEDAAALVGVELEDVANEQDEDADEEQESDDRERDEDEGLDRRAGIEEVEIEGVEGGEGEEEQQQAHAERNDDGSAAKCTGSHASKFTRVGGEVLASSF